MRKSSLPSTVELIPGAVIFRHDSRVAVRSLATILLQTPEPAVSTVVAQLLSKGLMYPRQWWVRLPAWIAHKRGVRPYDFWKHVLDARPSMASEMLLATADHMAYGQDMEDVGSAGGFSQRELNFIANLMAIVNGDHGRAMEEIAESNSGGAVH